MSERGGKSYTTGKGKIMKKTGNNFNPAELDVM